MLEDSLSSAWGELTAGNIAGWRRTNWFFAFLQTQTDKFDYAFVDVGPSLGALNRSILMAADHFITPVTADAFSLLGIRNIATWMSGWSNIYSQALDRTAVVNPAQLDRFVICRQPAITRGFIGCVLQLYMTGPAGDPLRAYNEVLGKLDREIEDNLRGFATDPSDPTLRLHGLPQMHSIHPISQAKSAPLTALTRADGLNADHLLMRDRHVQKIDTLARTIIARVEGLGATDLQPGPLPVGLPPEPGSIDLRPGPRPGHLRGNGSLRG